MKTLIAMVTIGSDNWTRRSSVRRAKAYAEKHGYDFAQITEPSIPAGERTPHWEKTLVPRVFPDYERYLVIDDDILINHRIAPCLPEIPTDHIGLVREPLPTLGEGPIQWVGNTGVMIVLRDSRDLLEAAYLVGEVTDTVPGFGEQPAINRVAWAQRRVCRMEWKWNYILMADWLITAHGQSYPWTPNIVLGRLAKVTLALRLALEPLARIFRIKETGAMLRLKEGYFVHLIWFRMGAELVDRYLG
jgi:hypothetical protein